MDITLITKLIYALGIGLVTGLASIIGVFMKKFIDKLHAIEAQQKKHMTYDQVKDHVNANVDPMRKQLSRLEDKIDKLIDYIIRQDK